MKTLTWKLKLSTTPQLRRTGGFTLIEFLVAMAMFLVIGGATFAMFANNAPVFVQQQNTASLNIALQNVVSQMQLDLVNAGTGYYPGFVLPSWPVGVTIYNQPYTATACNNAATYTYTASCYDTLNILTINSTVPPTHPTDSTGGTTSSNCSCMNQAPSSLCPAASAVAQDTSETFYIQASPGMTLAQTAAGFSQGSQVILVQSTSGGGGDQNGGTSGGNPAIGAANGAKINTFVLTGAPVVNAHTVGLPFNASSATGVNSTTDDPLGISTSSLATNVGTTFCSGDWLMRLDPTTYQVNVSNPNDPELIRVHTVNGVTDNDVIAEQIIGFKVGAATWQTSGTSTSTPLYNFYEQNAFNATPIGYNNNFALVRAVRVTLIGRTVPNPTNVFRNTFDGGPYQVLGADVVINPRNMTMN
jgi:prepilin-type N-terminal cleavage/methylation domain-containing protein